MKPLQIYWPFKPYNITQKWGNPNPAYANQFNNPDFKLHNGIDANVGKYNWDNSVVSEYPVYCPVEGFTVQKVDFSPQGGGNEMWLMSDDVLQIGDQLMHAWIPLCHAKKILVSEGDKPKLGELLMIADNTGFSTGIHTHMGLYRVDIAASGTIRKIDTNFAEGSTDPALYFVNKYAVDNATLATLITSNLRYYKYKLGGA